MDNGRSVILKLNVNADFPQILLTNCDSNGRKMNGIYLFINETISILKYLNSRFTFEDVIRENLLSKDEQMFVDEMQHLPCFSFLMLFYAEFIRDPEYENHFSKY